MRESLYVVFLRRALLSKRLEKREHRGGGLCKRGQCKSVARLYRHALKKDVEHVGKPLNVKARGELSLAHGARKASREEVAGGAAKVLDERKDLRFLGRNVHRRKHHHAAVGRCRVQKHGGGLLEKDAKRLSNRKTGFLELGQKTRPVGLFVVAHGLKKERLLGAEGGVKARRIDADRLADGGNRRRLVAKLPEDAKRLLKRFFAIKGARPSFRAALCAGFRAAG